MACNRFAWLFQIGGWWSEWNFFFNQLIPANSAVCNTWTNEEKMNYPLSFVLDDVDGNKIHTWNMSTFFKHITNAITEWENNLNTETYCTKWTTCDQWNGEWTQPTKMCMICMARHLYIQTDTTSKIRPAFTCSLRVSAFFESMETTASAIKCCCWTQANDSLYRIFTAEAFQ